MQQVQQEDFQTSSQEEMAMDPSSLVSHLTSQTADVAEDDSDSFESDDEVKAVLEQLDQSIPLLDIYSRAIIDPVVSQDNKGDGEIEMLDQDQGAGRAGDDRPRDERSTNPAPRRSNRLAPVSRSNQ